MCSRNFREMRIWKSVMNAHSRLASSTQYKTQMKEQPHREEKEDDAQINLRTQEQQVNKPKMCHSSSQRIKGSENENETQSSFFSRRSEAVSKYAKQRSAAWKERIVDGWDKQGYSYTATTSSDTTWFKWTTWFKSNVRIGASYPSMPRMEETSSTNDMTEDNSQLKRILSNLKAIANSGTDVKKAHLIASGYASSIPNEPMSQEQLNRVLEMAINEAIQEKMTEVNNDEIEQKNLHRLLGTGESKAPCPEYFTWLQNFEKASSPGDMAEHINDLSVNSVKNLIQNQLSEMRWNTKMGERDDYTFYELRRANVKATLYKECRSKYIVDYQTITKKELCPIVYMKTPNGWKTWDAVTKTFTNCEKDCFWWMDKPIKTFIEENADTQADDESKLERSLKKPTLYWAVLHDRDCKPSGKLKLEPISQTQVYVGKATGGIQGRWITDGKSHCAMITKCLDNVCAMATYDPSALDGVSLVDARLALAKVRGENTALVVMKTFGDDVETAQIVVEETEASLEQAERSRMEAIREYAEKNSELMIKLHNLFECEFALLSARTLDSKLVGANDVAQAEFHSEKAPDAAFDNAYIAFDNAFETCQKLNKEVQRLREELIKVTNDLSIAKKSLDDAEKLYRQGKTVEGSKIIDNEWRPTDMRYGMNINDLRIP